jgi:hypothetical protein
MMRKLTTISATSVVVDIVGIGVNGRVFSSGPHSSGKVILIEAYSLVDSQKYQLPLNGAQLMQFLRESGRLDLLKAGRKMALIGSLLQHCYFEYTLRVPPLPSDRSRKTQIMTVTDLDRIPLPEGYPQSIEDVVNEMFASEEKKRFIVCPTFEQVVLKISHVVREGKPSVHTYLSRNKI